MKLVFATIDYKFKCVYSKLQYPLETRKSTLKISNEQQKETNLFTNF